ncbi:CHAT domain-containing protein [Allomuricauda sp. R78024]|uniref:CHAT domain-containing protein n=1 Tax=Allomuricauda sp. R78024 TaxID=3093867 RepID=UPI0037C84CA3
MKFQGFFLGSNSLVSIVCIFFSFYINAQRNNTLKEIDSLIALNEFVEAQKIIQEEIHNNDNTILGHLVYPTGKIEFLQNPETKFEKALKLFSQIDSAKSSDSVLYQANLGMGLLYIDQGTVSNAQEYLETANALAKRLSDITRMVESEYHLSELGLKLGDFGELVTRTDKAIKLIRKNKNIDFKLAPRIYNYKGALMHFSALPDSANYFFEKAIKAVDNTNPDPEQTDYLPGTIYGNWFLVKQSAGMFDDAMKFTLKSINHYNSFLKKTNNHPLTEKVHGNLTISYRNLGSLYYDLGQKEKAKQIALLGYKHAKKHFLKNTIQYFGAALMVGESLLYNTDLNEAEKFLEEARASLNSIPGNNYSYKANLYGVLGDLAYRKGTYSEAVTNFKRTIDAYRNSNEHGFSQNEVYATINLAKSYAYLENYDTAESTINATLSKVITFYGDDSYLANEVRIAKVKIVFDKKDYKGTIKLSNQILDSYESVTFNNAISKEFFSPNQLKLLLYLIKAKYETDSVKSAKSLNSTISLVNRALQSIEKRKSLVTSDEDANVLLENSQELFDFGKELYYRLYDKTKDEKYLNKLIELHESAIYHRIRTRLNLSKNQLAPESIRQEENQNREALNSFFNLDEETQFDVDEWENTLAAWQKYLSKIKEKYPRYYEMRYQSVVTPLSDLQHNIAHNTTLVRYLFLENNLIAFIITNDTMKIVPISMDFSFNCINIVSNYQKNIHDVSECLHKLYLQLWKPIENNINTKNIIIFPDRELFNLSFELLTPKKINSFGELANNSLLNKHNIAYNYSLLLLEKNHRTFEFEDNFVAYSPTFNESMKEEYQLAINDSIHLDKTYLTLLPQPFSTDIAKRLSKRFGGESFLNENASKTVFSRTANEHKIIHIGTHAESNNRSPELSRLVFAKNVSDSTNINDNYLYAYEIYNQNLNSNLAILTACDTGKPAYQPGEGMISLAHAFNYAGSESILTSLWQIDEQSSTQILGFFYSYLENGQPKDEALRLAKLDYLKTAEGRTLHPQYWAGLVLMGNTSPIEISQPFPWLWVIGGIILILLLTMFLKRKAFNKN